MSSEAPRRAVIVGASSGVGRSLAERLARSGFAVALCARDERDLQANCADISLRHGVRAVALPLDLGSPKLDPEAFHRDCAAALGGPVDALLVTAGDVHAEHDGFEPAELMERLTRINFLGPMEVISVFARELQARGRGSIVAFSSIAAGRPRRRNAVYSAAKAALASYCGSLQHALAGTEVRVQVYALGYVDTAMSFGQKLLFPIASPESVAEEVVTHLDRGVRFRYFPRFWWAIVTLLRALPWFLFKRLQF